MAQEHYFSAEPTTNSKETAVEFEVAGQLFQLSATSGTFSSTALDTGTNVLLSHFEKFPSSGNVLDLGCGWGPIAVSVAALRPDTTVWALDVNERSLATTSKNAKKLGLKNIRAVLANQIPSDTEFTGIWSNPPIRVGKKVLHELMKTYLPKLAAGGEAYLVVQKHLGADSFQKWLAQEFQDLEVSRHDNQKTFRVIRVFRPATSQSR